jgi:hypothetical protein
MWKKIVKFLKWFINLFRRQQYELWVTYNKDDRVFGEPAPIRDSHRFHAKRIYKLSPKHIRFKDDKWRKIEIKSKLPMDYMTREID